MSGDSADSAFAATTLVEGPPTLGRDDPPDAAPPDALSRYELRGELGRGGLGIVYDAWDPELSRRVAIKLVRQESRDPAAFARFLREARSLAALSHPNVVKVFDVGQYDRDRAAFIVMELVEGQSLDKWLSRERSVGEILATFVAAGEGLAAAHERDIIHRDFKPANAIVGDDGLVRVLDFGLATAAKRGDTTGGTTLDDASGIEALPPSSLTETGAVMGTPRYMAPEQHARGDLGPSVDQYAWCIALWSALRGSGVFEETSLLANVDAKRNEAVRPAPAADRTPPWLEPILRRGLRVEPEQRWPSMEALLARVRRGPPRRVAMGGAVVGLGVLAAVGWALMPREEPTCEAAAQRASEVLSADRLSLPPAVVQQLPPDAAAEALAAIDAWAERSRDEWSSAMRASCRAEAESAQEDTRTRDVQRACLDSVLEGWAAVAASIEHATPESAAQLGAVLAEAPRATRCASEEGRADAPLPNDERREAVATLRGRLSGIDTRRRAEADGDIAAELVALRGEAEDLGYEPLLAEIELAIGLEATGRGAQDDAETAWRRAIELAETNRHDRIAVRAWSHLAAMYAGRLGDTDTAMRHLRNAQARVDALGRPPRLTSEVALQRASVLIQAGEFREAEAILVAEDAQRELHSPTVQASISSYLAVSRARQGRGPEAIAGFEETIARNASVLGEHHPTVGTGYLNLGMARVQQGDHAGGQRDLEKAAAILEPHPATDPLALAFVYNALCSTHRHRERYPAALEAAERALAILDERVDQEHPILATVLMNKGVVQSRLGDDDAALRTHQRALAIKERLRGPDHLDVADSLISIANIETKQGALDSAEARLLRALEIGRGASPDASQPRLAQIALMRVAMARGDFDAAASWGAKLEQWLRGSDLPTHLAAQTRDALDELANARTEASQTPRKPRPE